MRELRKFDRLADYTIHARDGDIGRLRQFYFDDREFRVRYLVVHTGGWLFGREALLLPDMVVSIDDQTQRIVADVSRDQIRHAPLLDEQAPVSDNYQQAYHRYYRSEPYWTGDPMFGPGPAGPRADKAAQARSVDALLRSSDELRGRPIRARDGAVGKVGDFIVETPGWTLRYLDVPTGPWLFGREVLVSCTWIERIDRSAGEIDIVLTREAIETAPAYDPARVIDRDYQVALFKHYGLHFDQD